MSNREIFRLAECSVEIDGRVILAPQEFVVRDGDFVTISGRSGSGKSTLLQLLLGFIRPSSGTLYFKGVDINKIDVVELRKSVAVVFQEPVLIGKTVKETLLEPFSYKCNHHLMPSDSKIIDILVKLDIRVGLDSSLSTLSGGEKQRVALARVLLMEREVLVLDEITSALDEQHRKLVFEVVRNAGVTVIAVSHDSAWIECSPHNLVVTEDTEKGVV